MSGYPMAFLVRYRRLGQPMGHAELDVGLTTSRPGEMGTARRKELPIREPSIKYRGGSPGIFKQFVPIHGLHIFNDSCDVFGPVL